MQILKLKKSLKHKTYNLKKKTQKNPMKKNNLNQIMITDLKNKIMMKKMIRTKNLKMKVKNNLRNLKKKTKNNLKMNYKNFDLISTNKKTN